MLTMIRFNEYLKSVYGEKVYKLALSSGCTCPNRDGTLGFGGCVFCSRGGSGDFASPPAPVEEQIELAKRLIAPKTGAKKFIAYFQSFTNTYGDVPRLTGLYTKAMIRDDIVALSLGTRPDCLGPDVMRMLERLNAIKPVWVELGLQTAKDETARRLNRCYTLPVFEEGYKKLKDADLAVVVHVIFGLPGESREDMLATVRYLSGLTPPPDGVKLQMLHVLRGTALGEQYEKEPFPLLTMDEYADLVAESVKLLPENTIIHRMTGDGPGRLLIAPDWTRNKRKVLNAINSRLT